MPTPAVTTAAAPTLPNPDDRDTFNARAYAFNAWEVTELAPKGDANAAASYANAVECNAAAALATGAQATATAAANFKGAWSGLSGALAVPASVSHAGAYWMLLQNLANVTTQTPGAAPTYWQQIGTAGGNAATGVNELAGPNIASAATTMDIWAAAQGNLMTVTGTTTTTGLPAAPQAGAERWLVAAGAWPLTAGANLLIAGVASGQTVTLAAGDMVLVRAITTTQFRCVVFRASGAPTVAGLLHVRDEKTAGTGAGSLTANAWNVRTLNTVVANTIAGASLGSNQVTLPAGTYDIEASAPQYSGSNTFHSRLKITNVTDGAALVYGQNVHHSLGGTAQLRARVTLAAQKVLQVEHWISVGVTVTGGEPQSAGTAEYYTELFIERVGA